MSFLDKRQIPQQLQQQNQKRLDKVFSSIVSTPQPQPQHPTFKPQLPQPTPKRRPIQPSPLSTSPSPSLSPSSSSSTSKMSKRADSTKKRKITCIQLEFVVRPLNVVSQALHLWKKEVQPYDVYFKIIDDKGHIKKNHMGVEQKYKQSVSHVIDVEAFSLYPGSSSKTYSMFVREIKGYSKRVTIRTDPRSFWWSQWCRTQFSDDDDGGIVIYQPHHFILNLLNTFHCISNKNNPGVRLLTLSENITLDQFYLNCKRIFSPESV